MNTPFSDWLEIIDPQGDTEEELEKDLCLQSWNRVGELCRATIVNKGSAVSRSLLHNLETVICNEKETFETYWKTYEKPPASGCGSSPTKQAESMMTHFWNLILDNIRAGWNTIYDNSLGQVWNDIMEENALIYQGRAGCGTCGSANACSSNG